MAATPQSSRPTADDHLAYSRFPLAAGEAAGAPEVPRIVPVEGGAQAALADQTAPDPAVAPAEIRKMTEEEFVRRMAAIWVDDSRMAAEPDPPTLVPAMTTRQMEKRLKGRGRAEERVQSVTATEAVRCFARRAAEAGASN